MAEVAADIGKGLARAALAGDVDGRLVDTTQTIAADAKLRIITSKDAEGLEILRHSTAHLLAQAVQAIYPEAQVTIGPVIEDVSITTSLLSAPSRRKTSRNSRRRCGIS